MQKVLTVSTGRCSMRSDIEGWTFEDGGAVHEAFCQRIGTENEYDHLVDVPVGLINGGRRNFPYYPTVLHAIGDGWKLLAPPQRYLENLNYMYEWWLVKD